MARSNPTQYIFVLAAVLIGAFGCGDANVESFEVEAGGAEAGSLVLDLVLAEGVEIDVVDWRLEGGGLDLAASVDVSGPGSTASIRIFGLPAVPEPYVVELSALSVDGRVSCFGSAEFLVKVDQLTEVYVLVECAEP